MTTAQNDYKDYLITLTALDAADSWYQVSNGNLSNFIDISENNYFNEWNALTPSEKEESEYEIFSELFDLIDEAAHAEWESEFNAANVSVAAKCKRRKSPDPA